MKIRFPLWAHFQSLAVIENGQASLPCKGISVFRDTLGNASADWWYAASFDRTLPFPFMRTLLLRGVTALLMLLLVACEQPPLLERIKAKGALRIATVTGPLTCHLGENGPAGVEYELARKFAHSLGIAADFQIYLTRQAALNALKRGEVQMVAAARQPTQSDHRQYLLSRPWHFSPLVFAQAMGWKPGEPAVQPVQVPADSLQQEVLEALPGSLPWEASTDESEERILEKIESGEYRRTLVSQALLSAMKSFYPSLVRGEKMEPSQGFHWYFSSQHDASLQTAADNFLDAQQQKGEIDKLIQRYITRLPKRDFVTLRDFRKHLKDRLPRYQGMFERAAKATGIDWRLLAAVGYQESHWRVDAVSPTGVRGIMMLTRDTARQEGIDDRTDPAQSIAGGARHLRWLEERIPERIEEPDRLWLTLASYNIGYGHLEDARVLTQRGGGNPGRWEDVKKFLPLLSLKKYYSTVKHGRARGREPVTYVENIRYYYRLLVWWDNQRRGLDCTARNYPRLILKN
ncbi:MAG TPA: membrane-bound lytic murein transglycosylase MltF [Chromatiaceae bacterium]|nr:membrane-bound lytic murein transglycosylase MltF [Chromatiaceae bacterium]